MRLAVLVTHVLATAIVLTVGGCRVSTPTALETRLITRAKQKITVGNKHQPNPLPATADNIATGKQAFTHYCFVCHGLDGRTTGVPFADKVSPPIPSLASPEVQAYTDGQLKWIIDNGLRPSGMPASKGVFSDDEIWSMVLYIRHLPPANSLGEPCVYTGECQQPEAPQTKAQVR